MNIEKLLEKCLQENEELETVEQNLKYICDDVKLPSGFKLKKVAASEYRFFDNDGQKSILLQIFRNSDDIEVNLTNNHLSMPFKITFDQHTNDAISKKISKFLSEYLKDVKALYDDIEKLGKKTQTGIKALPKK